MIGRMLPMIIRYLGVRTTRTHNHGSHETLPPSIPAYLRGRTIRHVIKNVSMHVCALDARARVVILKECTDLLKLHNVLV